MHKFIKIIVMKVRHSIKSAKSRDKNCKVVRRRGKIYVINKFPLTRSNKINYNNLKKFNER